jgi:O-methyltransferase involved in polyketide biosynthesis
MTTELSNQIDAQVHSRTAQHTPDPIGIGSTQGQRTAELVAAFRAEVIPSPEHLALISFKGSMLSAVFSRLVSSKGPFNFIIARSATFQHVIEQSNILADKPKIKIVEVAAGLSPRGLQLARTMPQAEIVEVDLPEVVREKQARYRRAKIEIPPNLTWRAADLGVTPLISVLENQQVDIILAEGLNQYFSPSDIQRIAHDFCQCLVVGGLYICDLSTEASRKAAIKEMHGAISFFTRHSGSFTGILANEDAAFKLLNEAGYGNIKVYRASEVAAEMRDIPKPILDMSLIYCAQKQQIH